MSWPFVGREDELQRIREAMRSEAGIVLAGTPGVGKTRLAYEAVTGADPRRHLSLWVAATPATTPIPLGALAPLLPTELPAATSPAMLLRGATDALLDRSGTRRLVLGVDDAHLLDEISATLVYQLAQTRRAFVLASLRSREPAPDPIRALWKDGVTSRIEVEALSQRGTQDVLVAALGGQVDGATGRRLWRAARGNLLLLRELVEAGIDCGALTEIAGVWHWKGPWVLAPRLVELISDRIGRLDRSQQEVLEIVAYGEPIGADVLTSLADQHVVEAVEAKYLIWTRQDGRRVEVRLGHPLYGEVLRAGCSPERASMVRRALADAVEATGARRKDDWLRVATWRLDAATPVRPAVLVAAASRAFAALDLPLAERLARTALIAGRDSAAGSAAGAVLWRVLFLSQRNAETEEVMAQLADTPMSDSQRGDYAVGRAYNLFWGLHRIDEAFALLVTTRDAINNQGWQDEIDLLKCVFQVMQAKAGVALRSLADLQARPALSPRAAAQVLVAQGIALVHLGRLAPARNALELATEPISHWTDEIPWLVVMQQMAQCQVALLAGRLREVGELATAFYEHAADTEWELPLRLSCGVQAQVARLRGRVRTAARWAREGRCINGHLPESFFRNHVLGELAHAEALAGNPAEALAAVTEADRRPAPSEALLQLWIELARPWVAVAAGGPTRAVELALDAAGYARSQEAAGFEAFALHDAVRLEVTHPEVERLQELAAITDSDLVRAFAEHAAAAAVGDPVGLEAVGSTFAGLGADLLAAEAYVQAARNHQRSGAAASDRRLRAQAALLLDGCEGARTPLVAGVDAPQLTGRERDIAGLAAQGLSNQEIADRLVISSRTVGNHLHHVYVKLGISGRSDLDALLPQPVSAQ
ncbi:MAG: LuxR C-terminal-related transcriptional regulator [Actinomycetota bacterium]|nr:LuxR C-terminal-related transcriptional regulator [Actinomycetota bacterium]